VLALTGSQSVTTAVSQVTHRCSLSQPRGTFDRYPKFCQLIPSKTELKLLLSEINLHTMRQNAVCLCKFVCGFKQPYRAISYITDDCRAFCRTLVVAHCAPTPMTCASCSCREHITNSVIGVSRPPVLDCGTTFDLDYGTRDLPSTPSDDL